MSTALRIASVTQVLKDLLNNGFIDHDITGHLGGNVTVTSWPPDKIETGIDKETTQLNIFMYQATYNQGWRNVKLPSFNQKGERISNPPLAIDLHYLLTAYGSAELHTDILLGHGMKLFHETPVLDREAIREAIGAPSLLPTSPPVTPLPPSLQLLSKSELAEQIEQIKISPEILSIEDISKLWAAFGVKYRPTAAYKATVVLIESSKSTRPGLPVKERKIYVRPFKQPVIEKISSQSAAGQPIIENQKILHNYNLVLKGNHFDNEVVEVNIDGKKIPGNLTVSNSELSFALPAGLKAGVREVQVNHPIRMGAGSPPELHNGVMSQGEAFILSPLISNIIPNVAGATLQSGDISFTLDPAVQKGQRVTMFLNELNNAVDPVGYSFQLPASFTLPASAITIPVINVKPANYLLRVQVDGAESPLGTDSNGKYNSPSVSI